MHYPGDYGFIVGTKCGDSDPLDVLILVEEPTFPGCRVLARPIGVLFMEDEGGDDEKILAVPQGDPRFAEVYDLKDLPHHWLTEVENFFATYKVLEGKTARTGEWKGAGKPAWHWRGAGVRKNRRTKRRQHLSHDVANEKLFVLVADTIDRVVTFYRRICHASSQTTPGLRSALV